MKLAKIKLAGFKSFVDPTTLQFNSALTGIVGPNGCGKSNVIDAVRWVMGESSAKQLRGDSMADVIFNGSSARKPVGQASIELVFDNSDGKLGGEYASYSEISVRRVVSRDGISDYFLNGTRCRRKDITQLFLGTGLGPRSYAIIEQGMISQVIEARPEELRVFIEEAAGISKYKERRRETETRIGHTRENLDRLNDLREEITKQLEHLEMQRQTAEKYTRLQEKKRRLEAEMLALRLRDLNTQAQQDTQQQTQQELALEAVVSELRSIETGTEQHRVKQLAAQDALAEVQERLYRAGADIARREQEIQHRRSLREREEQERTANETQLADLSRHLKHDQTELEALASRLTHLEPEVLAAKEREIELQNVYEQMHREFSEVEQLNFQGTRALAETEQKLALATTRIEHLSQQLTTMTGRVEQIEQEQVGIDIDSALRALEELRQKQQQEQTQLASLQERLATHSDSLNKERDTEQRLLKELQELRTRLAEARGRLTSLKNADPEQSKRRAHFEHWLKTHGWSDQSTLGQVLEVDAPWAAAAELVLAPWLNAITLADDPAFEAAQEVNEGAAEFVLFTQKKVEAKAHTLAAKVRAPAPVLAWLNRVHVAPNIPAARALLPQLKEGESIVTTDGAWLGDGWLCISRASTSEQGVLAREAERRTLESQIAQDSTRLNDMETLYQHCRARLQQAETARDETLQRVHASERQANEWAARCEERERGRDALKERVLNLRRQHDDLVRERERLHRQSGETKQELEQWQTQLQTKQVEQEQNQEVSEQQRQRLELARTQAEAARTQTQTLIVQLESQRSTQATAANAINRWQQQSEQLRARTEELKKRLAAGVAPLQADESELQQVLSKRASIEQQMSEVRRLVEDLEIERSALEEKRSLVDQAVQTARDRLNELRLAGQEIRVRRETVQEQLAQTQFTWEQLEPELPAEASPDQYQESLERLLRRIERLGPINLAAIDEFNQQSERKQYLDAQHADLIAGLDILEEAIRKIDRETRARFKETFDRINEGLQKLFPRLFGGGTAYIELTDNDLLAAGVTVMARPPGKRNSTIHLLSGGEKALTAVALIFSIFELSPAPFCLLDEVDAPLDDNNVGRFCDLVREMSSRVQFVVITHNKVTMEMVQQLTGVTMREAGVSRLVAVDIEEAVAMAAS